MAAVSSFLSASASTDSADAALTKPGDTIFTLDLADPAVRSQLTAQGAEVVNAGPSGEPCLKITAPASGNKLVAIPFDVSKVRGDKVCFLASLRAENVVASDPTKPLKSWDGAKFQTYYDSASAGKKWTDESKLAGSFPWREVGRIVGVEPDATNGKLNVGLGNALGTVWVTGVRIILVAPKVTRPVVDASASDFKPVTKLRGVMTPNTFNEQDFNDMAAWKVNCLRWHMQGVKRKPQTQTYEQWLDEHLDDLARALDAAQARGMKVAVNLMDTPGGREPDGSQEMFLHKEDQDEFVADWEKIARRFKGNPAILGYDLVNEPVQNHPSPPGVEDWLGLQIKTAKAIRAIDPDVAIILEVDQWDSVESYTWMKPIDLPNVIYQAHMYWPATFTHQGVFTNQGVAKDMNMAGAVNYPGIINGQMTDKEALRKYLQPLRDFQLAYHVPVFIGEFSAIRWAPGASHYIDDCISIFEENGWDWAYHAFREWPGWSVEHADLPYDRDHHPLATQPTDREIVLKKWLSKNAAAPTPAATGGAGSVETSGGAQ